MLYTLASMHTEMKGGHMDMKKELKSFFEMIKHNMREVLRNFKEEAKQKILYV